MYKCEDGLTTAFSLTVLYIILSNRYVYKCSQKVIAGCKLNDIADVSTVDGEPLVLGRALHAFLFFTLALSVVTDNITIMIIMLSLIFLLNFIYAVD